MSDETTLPDMMNQLRELKHALEVIIADTVRKFEETTGLTVEGIELIRKIESGADTKTRVAGVKLTMRL